MSHFIYLFARTPARAALVLGSLLLCTSAWAQDSDGPPPDGASPGGPPPGGPPPVAGDPTQRLTVVNAFSRAEAVTGVRWNVSAGAGLTWAAGNANAFTVSANVLATRTHAKSKLTLSLEGAYGEAQLPRIGPVNPPPWRASRSPMPISTVRPRRPAHQRS
jgi:hypothetical protein